jgi:hypothetical protein
MSADNCEVERVDTQERKPVPHDGPAAGAAAPPWFPDAQQASLA